MMNGFAPHRPPWSPPSSPAHGARAAISSGNAFRFYADSVGGSNLNDGLSPATPKQTLAAVRTLALAFGDGATIGLAAGSTWREALNLSTLDGVTVGAYGEGAPPVITGCDIKTGWTNDGTFTNLWYKDITHDTSGTNRSIVLQDGVLMNRLGSTTLANGTTGAYYSADAGTRIYINPGGNPNSNGKVYEVAVRQNAVFLGNDSTLTGIVARGAMSNNGPIELGTGGTIERCVSAFGTKHNILLGSGSITDCVYFEADKPTATETGRIMFVGFVADATGLDLTLTRNLFFSTLGADAVYAHTLNDPAASHRNITIDQCIHKTPVGSVAWSGGAVGTFTVSKSASYGAINSSFAAFASTSVLSHSMMHQGIDIDQAANSGTTTTWTQCCVERSGFSGGSRPAIGVRGASGVTSNISHCSVVTPGDFSGAAVGWVPATSLGTLTLNRSLIVGNNALIVQASSQLSASNRNVYVQPTGGFGLYNTFDTYYALPASFAGWRAATGDDANSIALTSSPFTGTTANGDFRINTSALTGAGHDGDAGCTEHWDFNIRAIAAGPPSRWPVPPQTYAEAIAYIQDPENWDFYP